MKKNSYYFNVVENTLTLTADFADALNNPNSDEYKLLRQFQCDFPNLRIVRKTRSTPTRYHNSDGSITAYNKNKRLTYKRMEQFMGALPDGKKYLDEYNKLCKTAKEMCLAPYAPVARWFMAQFPNFRDDPLFYVDNPVEVIDYAAFLKKTA